jgi:hypothetical protein
MMFTNHKDALPLDATDRRYCILSSPAERRPDEYYAGPWEDDPLGLWDWTDANLPKVYDFVKTYSLEGFNANGSAPETEGLKEMTERGASELDEWVQSQLENCGGLLTFDLVVIEHLVLTMPDHLKKRGYGRNAMAKAIEKIGGVQHPRRAQLSKTSSSRIWVIRNHDNWTRQGEGVLGRAYVQFISGAADVKDLNSPERMQDALSKIGNAQTALLRAVEEVGKGPM